MLELKVLKVTLRAKEEKERYRLGEENWVGRNGRLIMKDFDLIKRGH